MMLKTNLQNFDFLGSRKSIGLNSRDQVVPQITIFEEKI